jgi:uncharacterized protein (TIGR02996 family)
MTTADALLAAVCAAPDDDLPRLVYADWCEENGDGDRGEFIRLQVQSAAAPPSPLCLIREKVLLDTHAGRWLAPLRQPGGPLFTQRSHGQFRRGFVETVWMPARWFLSTADRLFALAPVTRLRVIFDEVSQFGPLAGCEHLGRLRELDVCDSRFGAGGTVRLCRNPHLAGLAVLRLSGCGIDDAAAKLLCDSRLSLTLLDVRHNPLSAAARARLRERFGPAVTFE